MWFPPSWNMLPSSSTTSWNSVSSVPVPMDSNFPLDYYGIFSAGTYSQTPPRNPSVSRKNPLELLGSSPSPASKKQNVSGKFMDQSIEQLNDVTAVSGVNLREEEEQLISVLEDSRLCRKPFLEEEETLILDKTALRKKLEEIMGKCGLKNISDDVERCLLLSVEERMWGLIERLIRLSKQRVDTEKTGHHTITTSDIRLEIMARDQRAKDELEKKHAGDVKLCKLKELQKNNVVDDGKEDKRRDKSFEMLAKNEEDDKMRRAAVNAAAHAAVGGKRGEDMLSKWRLMAEQARQIREATMDSTLVVQVGKDVCCKPSAIPGRTMTDHQAAENTSVLAPGGGGRSQSTVPQSSVGRIITVKDVVAVLEREPQMSKSALIYRLNEKL